MNNTNTDNRYIINPYIITLSYDHLSDKFYILSEISDSIRPINIYVNDINKNNLNNICIDYIKTYINSSIVDINIRLLDIHSIEVAKYNQNTGDTIYPLYGVILPYSASLIKGYWIEFNFLEPNPFSYSIMQVSQHIQ